LISDIFKIIVKVAFFGVVIWFTTTTSQVYHMWADRIGTRLVLISLGVVLLGNASNTEAGHVCEHRLLNLCGVTVTSFSGCNTRPV
jgi:hypothetical protein